MTIEENVTGYIVHETLFGSTIYNVDCEYDYSINLYRVAQILTHYPEEGYDSDNLILNMELEDGELLDKAEAIDQFKGNVLSELDELESRVKELKDDLIYVDNDINWSS